MYVEGSCQLVKKKECSFLPRTWIKETIKWHRGRKTALEYYNFIEQWSVVGFSCEAFGGFCVFFFSLKDTIYWNVSSHLAPTPPGKKVSPRVIGSDLDRRVTERARPSISAVCAVRQRCTTQLDIGSWTGAILEERSKSPSPLMLVLPFATKQRPPPASISLLAVAASIKWSDGPHINTAVSWQSHVHWQRGQSCIDIIKVPSVLDPHQETVQPQLYAETVDGCFRWLFLLLLHQLRSPENIEFPRVCLFAKRGSHLWQVSAISTFSSSSQYLTGQGCGNIVLSPYQVIPKASSFYGCNSFQFCT